MKAVDLKIGSVIETSVDGKLWKESTITKISEKYVWFSGSGYSRIAKQTFVNYPTLYRIKSL